MDCHHVLHFSAYLEDFGAISDPIFRQLHLSRLCLELAIVMDSRSIFPDRNMQGIYHGWRIWMWVSLKKGYPNGTAKFDGLPYIIIWLIFKQTCICRWILLVLKIFLAGNSWAQQVDPFNKFLWSGSRTLFPYPYGGFQKWCYPQIDDSYWKIPLNPPYQFLSQSTKSRIHAAQPQISAISRSRGGPKQKNLQLAPWKFVSKDRAIEFDDFVYQPWWQPPAVIK